jgi:hypothetical protein
LWRITGFSPSLFPGEILSGDLQRDQIATKISGGQIAEFSDAHMRSY